MPYQTVWSKCNVFGKNEERTTLRRGEFVPDGIVNGDPDQVARLVTVGALQFVEPVRVNVPEPVAEPDAGTDIDDGSDELVKPAESDVKAAWVEYATDVRNPRRISADDARQMSKPALMDHFKD